MSRRRLACLAASAAVLAGCGEQAEPVERNPSEGEPVTLTGFEAELEQAGLDVVQTGGGQDLGAEVAEGIPVSAETRYEESRTGREFEVLVFPDVALARRALPGLIDTDVRQEDGFIARGANVVVVFPDGPIGNPVINRVRALLADLRERERERAPGAGGSG